MKIFDHNTEYTDEEWMEFAREAFRIHDEDIRDKLQEFVTFVIGDPKPRIDRVYGESMLSQYKSNSILLPCGCPAGSVTRWTEAMFHILKPENCPTLNKKEKSI